MPVKTGKMSKQAWMVAPETVKVMEALHSRGGQARFVGGCVRNALVNRRVIDIDIATPLVPDDVMDRLKEHKIKNIPTGFKHGTVTAVVDNKAFEITTLRKDMRGYGRHADVLFTDDWRTDASRRDFTINALYATMEGEIFDYFGGIEDLRRGKVVFVGDPETRIREDILRILRFFRFFAHFGQGAADPAALRACSHLANKIPTLSVERIRQETFKLLEADKCAEVWQLMLENGVATYFIPEATNTAALKKLTTLEYIYHDGGTPLRRLAALLNTTEDGALHIVKGLKLSNAQSDQLVTLFRIQETLKMDMSEKTLRQIIYRIGNDMARSLLLLGAARSGEEGNLFDLYGIATSFRPPRFPLIGEDVIALGYKQGPEIGRILGEVEKWWINEDFRPGRSESLKKLKEEHSKKTPPQQP
jgi:poly(A) polymerase